MPPALASWNFSGSLRHYQSDVLSRVDVHAGSPLHIVAPPGSGKTLLGLLLAVRRGHRAVVLTPTVTIREQWVRQAGSLAPDATVISADPERPGDLTALTYQALSVLDAANPLEGLARARWRDELVADGRGEGGAGAWLTELEARNARAYRSGIARRSRTLRRQLVREDPDLLAAALHPNALALMDRLVAHGVETIVLDECHHLLDHWALVVATLAARVRAAGREPLLIGLTATLPSPDDADEYDNYTSLLGEVDYEVPVPAVVREGNLAPYRDLVRFAEPTREELAFLAAHADALAVLLRATFAGDTGLAYLAEVLQPQPAAPPVRSELEPPAPASAVDATDARLAAAFAGDFAGSEGAAAMLSTVAPLHPLVAHLPDAALRTPSTDESLRLLARFALDRLLPDPSAAPLWERIRRTLADFGYALTDRGVRRTRDPVDTMLASSLAKDHAACDILRIERSALGDDRLRALVVSDFAEHGNTHGGLVGTAGALRTFGVIAADASTAGLRSMLVTGGRTRVATRDADTLVRALGECLGVPVASAPLIDQPHVSEVHAPGVGAASLVRAASVLLTRGDLHVVVGTRGLFGEGWDCPAVNTLIDLTAVATASATQQLRGRTLRLDSGWPEKVAHNWTVTALLPAGFAVDAAPDAARLRRKHERLWGLDVDDPSRVVRGLPGALSTAQRDGLRAVLRRDVPVAVLNDLLELPARARTRAAWRIGDAYVDREGVSALVSRRRSAPVFRTSRPVARALGVTLGGVVLGAVALGVSAWAIGPAAAVGIDVVLLAAAVWCGIPLAVAWRHARALRVGGVEAYRRIGTVVWDSLRGAGRVTDAAATVVVASADGRSTGAADGVETLTIMVPEAAIRDQRTFSDALGELFGPVRTPRFLLETGRGGRSWVVRAVLRRPRGAQYVPVPSAIGRRREDAERFAAAWERTVGPCVLHPMDHPGALTLMAQARRGGAPDGVPAVREEWR